MTKIIRTWDNHCLTLNPELEDLPIDTKLTFGRSGVPKPEKMENILSALLMILM